MNNSINLFSNYKDMNQNQKSKVRHYFLNQKQLPDNLNIRSITKMLNTNNNEESYNYLYNFYINNYKIKNSSIKRQIETIKKNMPSEVIKSYMTPLNNQTLIDIVNNRNINSKQLIELKKDIKQSTKLFEINYNNIFNYIKNGINNIMSKPEKTETLNLNTEDIVSKIGVKLFMEVVKKIILSKPEGTRLVFNIDDVGYTFTHNTDFNRLINALSENMRETAGPTESDEAIIISMREGAADTSITYYHKSNTNSNTHVSEFFKYYNLTHYDLTRYQIYNKGNNVYKDNCLTYALNQAGVKKSLINELKIIVKTPSMIGKHYEQICDICEIQIRVNKLNNNKSYMYTFGEKYTNIINIGIIDEHCFINEKTNITSYALKHYKENHNPDCLNKDCNLYRDKTHKDITRGLDSFNLIKLLIEMKDDLLEEITINDKHILKTQFYDNVNNDINDLQYDKSCIRRVRGAKYDNIEDEIEDDIIKSTTNIFFDFETFNDKINKVTPFVVHAYYEKTNCYKKFRGLDCALKFLFSIQEDCTLIAHNMKFDASFLFKHMYNYNEITKNGAIYQISACFNNFNIKIKDSYKLITEPLRKFPKMFKLQSKKEAMPYKFYNNDNIEDILNNKLYNINDILPYFKNQKEQQIFINNIKELNYDEKNINMMDYCDFYCKNDVEILKDGYNIFRQWILSETTFDINHILTISSLSHKYMIKQGCYDNVYELSGIPQLFISKSVVGGRTMSSENKKHYLTFESHGYINDFDGVSLYPSAMVRLNGFLKGTPKVLKYMNYNFIKKQDGYFVEIYIKSVGINRKMPLLSNKKNDVRIFTNDIIGKKYIVDKIALEDLIKFQQIDFDIIRGYYFNQGFNTRVKEVINNLFNTRQKYKKEKNPVEKLYKLILNSAYGKTILKPSEYSYKFFDKTKDFEVYLCKNFNYINKIIKFNETENGIYCKYKVEVKEGINKHFNIPQVGSSILSMSKRIMNEVICTAEDNNIEIYYQDTDSMHLKDTDINKLSTLYENIYKRELIGESLGQFHSDFSILDEDDNSIAKDVKATTSIFLGKKFYIDVLEGTDFNGEKIQDLHIRCKGVNANSLLYNNYNDNDILNIYKELYNGKEYIFDLTCNNNRVLFKHGNDKNINSLSVFNRTIKF